MNQRTALDFFLVVSRFGQGTVAAIEIGVGDVINNPGGAKPILAANDFEELPLPDFGILRLPDYPGRRLNVSRLILPSSADNSSH